jgi:hypothetical protein
MRTLSLKDVDATEVQPGETVVVEDETGEEVVGEVYIMSGGGKGPAGKSKAKYRSEWHIDQSWSKLSHARTSQTGTASMESTALSSSKSIIEPADKSDDRGVAVEQEKAEKDKLEKAARRAKRASAPSSTLSAWTKALPKAVLEPSVKFDQAAFEKLGTGLSAFAPPFMQAPVVVGPKGDLIPGSPGLPPPAQYNRPVTPTKKSAWARGPPLALKKVTIDAPSRVAVVNSNEVELKTPTGQDPASAYSLFGTDSDPATPWYPALKYQLEQSASEGSTPAATVQTAPIYPTYLETHQAYGDHQPQPVPAMYAHPTYPWGMPMSPIPVPGYGEYGQGSQMPMIPGGPGVMWTPAGRAVQDAAMKNALRAAEAKTRYGDVKTSQPKSYFKSRSCHVLADNHSSTVQILRRRLLSARGQL